MAEEKRPAPGDPGYKGGEFYTTVYVDGKPMRAHIIKDANGNIVYSSVTPKFLGIF